MGGKASKSKSCSSSPSSAMATSSSLKPYIEALIDGKRNLTGEETYEAFQEILKGADPVQVSALLVLLRAKGEVSDEIAGMIRAMNDACESVPFSPTAATATAKRLDIVGTGGDGAHTINISTAAAVLAAACGCVVAKAGNRSVSSQCGSADVLEQLGVAVQLTPTQQAACLKEAGIVFLFAPINHPAMRHVVPVRKSLKIRTCFNVLGPLTNAARANRNVIGVFDKSLMPLVAGALQKVGVVDHAVVVHGCGLDEISPVGPSQILELTKKPNGQGYEETTYEFDPLTVDIPRCQIQDLKGGAPDENASLFRQVLAAGTHTDAKRDAVILNAAFGVYVYGLTETIADAVTLARSKLQEGVAIQLLDNWIQISQKVQQQQT